jgi:hypothetical protein
VRRSNRTLYKVLVNGRSCHGGNLAWSLPTRQGRRWIPGQWQEVTGDLAMCSRGLHLTTAPYQSWWKWGATAYIAEAQNISAWREDKCVCATARLLRPAPVPRWWAKTETLVASLTDLPWLKPDGKPLKAWRLFPTLLAAWDAAEDAARAAAWDAAEDAAEDAARAAAKAAARAAAWDAARAAAWDAAEAAAWDAAGVAGRNAAGDAALYVVVAGLCGDLVVAACHRRHVLRRWRVWQKGYGLLCDVKGTLFVYEQAR